MIENPTTVQGLINNAGFRNWAKGESMPQSESWNNWAHESPENEKLAKEGIKLVNAMSFKKHELDVFHKAKMWSEIENGTKKGSRSIFSKPVLRWAATLLLVGFVGVLYQHFNQDNLEYHTAFGEVMDVELEDGTHVHLNANSQLVVYNTILTGFQREVDLQGEAFFEVNKKSEDGQSVTFTVNTSKSSLEVLGTQFNVNTWGEATEVVLTEGMVKVKADFSRVPILMNPGEKVTLSDNEQYSEKVNTLFYTDWMAGK